ncbi:conserved hypothetical protein [Microsporum canis CBS 113480]|uniref:Uncharacterized protein n=1 Tax=Arthroderma otae (strain ATCC MYA-4605 / CBS 113480) TaxID=554155 RepID=C5FE27_ARTOC|nr:conserved hypothetical protein [Microsporum canis CBS 113480]EEQ28061.1 conserved hypothetical protein [Microsporum canis CBS 113480]
MANNDFLSLLRRLLEHVQEDPDYVESCLDSLSKDDRSAFKKFSRMLTAKPKGPKQKTTIKKITDISTIELSAGLQSRLKSWAENPALFFDGSVNKARNYSTVATIFSRIRQDEGERDILTIKRRFDLMALYRSAVSYGSHTGTSWRNNGAINFATIIYRDLSRYDKEDFNGIIRDVERWVDLGQGFYTWAEKLGSPGYLLIMPLGLCETKYAERHYHPKIEEGASYLRKIGIGTIAKEYRAVSVGEYISQNTLKHLGQLTLPNIPTESDSVSLRANEAASDPPRAHGFRTSSSPIVNVPTGNTQAASKRQGLAQNSLFQGSNNTHTVGNAEIASSTQSSFSLNDNGSEDGTTVISRATSSSQPDESTQCMDAGIAVESTHARRSPTGNDEAALATESSTPSQGGSPNATRHERQAGSQIGESREQGDGQSRAKRRRRNVLRGRQATSQNAQGQAEGAVTRNIQSNTHFEAHLPEVRMGIHGDSVGSSTETEVPWMQASPEAFEIGQQGRGTPGGTGAGGITGTVFGQHGLNYHNAMAILAEQASATRAKRRRPDIASRDLTGAIFDQPGSTRRSRNLLGQADSDVSGHSPMVTNRAKSNHPRVQNQDGFTQASIQQADVTNQLLPQSTAHLNLDNLAHTSKYRPSAAKYASTGFPPRSGANIAQSEYRPWPYKYNTWYGRVFTTMGELRGYGTKLTN